MLTELLAAAVFAAFVNIAIYIAAVKLRVFILLRVDPCFFCLMFWLGAGEYICAGLMGILPIYWTVFAALASAAIASFFFQFIEISKS